MTSVDRTAYPRFPRVVSGRELAEAFTPSDGEVDWARGRTQDARHLLALVVWLKSYQRLGYFPKPKLNNRQSATVRRMYHAAGPDGKRLHTVAEIAQTVGVHRTTVYDYLKKEG